MPERYLKIQEREKQRKEQERVKLAKEKKEKEEQNRSLKENQKIDAIYNSLNPVQQEEVEEEIKNRLSVFWKGRLRNEEGKSNLLRLTKAILRNKRREVIKDWVTSEKIWDGSKFNGEGGSILDDGQH